MDPASESEQEALELSISTHTMNLLSETVALTNCTLQGPASREDWSERVKFQWITTVNALQEVFFWRLGKVTEIDQIHRNCLLKLANLNPNGLNSRSYGLAIQRFAKTLHDYLQKHHAWHDPCSAQCICCQRQNLHRMQQDIMQQLDLLTKAVIPGQEI
jgi:hypothetical protein